MGIIDANSAGFVHGGTVMKLCDEAAGLAAVRHSRRRVVTAGVDGMTFLIPINVGELVTAGPTVWPNAKRCSAAVASAERLSPPLAATQIGL